jgi:hypothetical protein
MIHEWIVALECGLKVNQLTNLMHVYPTYSMAGLQAAADIRIATLTAGVTGKVLRGLVRLMR